MVNKNGNNFNTWINEPTAAKSSGLAFSVATVLPSAFGVWFMIMFSICGVTVSGENGYFDWYIYLNFLLPQVSFALAAMFGFRLYRKPIFSGIKQAAAKQKCHAKYFLIALLLQIGLFSLSEVNAWFLQFLGKFGYQDTGILLPSMDGFGIVGVLLCVAVLPAIMEETFFRGVVLNGLRSFGKWGGILLCGALFALYHQNPAQTLYQFCCGVAYALVAVRAGSVLPTMVAHCFNNALIIILAKCGITTFTGTAFLWIIYVSVACLLLSLVWLSVLDKPEEQEQADKADTTDKAEHKNFFIAAAIGIFACAISWLSTLINGL